MRKLLPERLATSAAAIKYLQARYNPSFISTQHIADALLNRGYRYFEAVHRLTPGTSVRIPTRGKASKNTAVQVSMFADAQGAYFTDYATGEKGEIWPNAGQAINCEESARLFKLAESKRRKQEAERQRLADKAAIRAQNLYRAGVSTDHHEYLRLKQLKGLYNALLQTTTGALMIPMWVSGVGLVNLQMIYPDGTKRFMAGARVKGAYSVIGSLHNAERVIVCEGWSTGVAVFELYSLPVVVAFNAGNLMTVCQVLHSRFENLAIVVAGDDDRQNNVNLGRQKAIEAAQSIGATLAFPELCKACRCSDFADVAICKRRRSNG